MGSKFLVYTVVNYTPKQLPLLQLMVESLVRFTSYKAFDFLILTNKDFVNELKKMKDLKKLNTLILEYEKRDTLMSDESFKKYTFWKDFPTWSNYSVALYMEYNCVVENDIVSRIFRKQTLTKGTLYPIHIDSYNDHMSYFYGLQDYTEEQLRLFQEKRVYPFSIGVMAFVPCVETFQHFNKMLIVRKKCQAQHGCRQFIDQSSMNKYYNSVGAADTSLLKGIVEMRNIKTNIEGEPTLTNTRFDTKTVINYFCGIGYYAEKELRMKRYLKKVIRLKKCRFHD